MQTAFKSRAPLVIAAIGLTLTANAQLSLAWARQFNGNLNTVDSLAEMKVDSVGNTYVAGTENFNLDGSGADIVLIKYSPAGRQLWKQTFDGSAHSSDVAFDLAISTDGFAYVVGRTNTVTQSSNYITIKYRMDNGAKVWQREFDGPLSSIDQAMGVDTDNLGNVFVMGEVWADHVPYSNGDYCTLKYDSDGNLAWIQQYNGPSTFMGAHDQPQTIVVDHAGDVIVSGNSNDVNNNARIATIKYSGATGSQLWLLRTEGMNLSGYQVALQIGSDNDVVVGGTTQDTGLQVFILRLDSLTGGPVWLRKDSFPHGGRLANRACMAIDNTDSIAISVTYDPDTDNSNLNYNIQTTKYNYTDGSQFWSVSYGTTARYDGQSADSVAMDAQGNVIVGGSDLFVPHNVAAVWKFDCADGHLVWKGSYDGPKQPDAVWRVRADVHGDIIAGGITGVDVGTGDSDVQVIKFSIKIPTSLMRR